MSFLVFVSISGNGSAASEIEWNDEHVGGGGLRRKNCGEETFDEDFRPAMIETASRNGDRKIFGESGGGREGAACIHALRNDSERKVETRKKKKRKTKKARWRRGEEEEEEASERTEEEVFARGWHEREKETAPSPSPPFHSRRCSRFLIDHRHRHPPSPTPAYTPWNSFG